MEKATQKKLALTLLYATIAFLQYLTSDESFRQWVNPITLAFMIATMQAMLAIKALWDFGAGNRRSDRGEEQPDVNINADEVNVTEEHDNGSGLLARGKDTQR